MKRTLFLSMAVAAALGIMVAASFAAKHNSVVSIGDKGTAFAELVGVDDATHSLGDYKDAKAVVLVFTCNSCPVAVAYEDRLIEFTNDYESRGVQVVAINVNNIEQDKLPAMKVRAEEKGFNFPYLYDSSQEIARAYGATVTPHAFLLDGNGEIAYMGAIDDSQDPAKVKQHLLRDAVDAVLAGQAPKAAESQQFGCTIKYD